MIVGIPENSLKPSSCLRSSGLGCTYDGSYGKSEELESLWRIKAGADGDQARIDDMYDQVQFAVSLFDRVGVRYHLIAGSALGLARHSGIIPWDDDVDLAVHANDAEKVWAMRDQFLSHGYSLLKADIGFKFGSGSVDMTCVERKDDGLHYFNPYLRKGLPFQPGHPFTKVTTDIFIMKEFGHADGVPVLHYASDFCRNLWHREAIPISGWYADETALFGGIRVRALPASEQNWYLSRAFGKDWSTHDGEGNEITNFRCLHRKNIGTNLCNSADDAPSRKFPAFAWHA